MLPKKLIPIVRLEDTSDWPFWRRPTAMLLLLAIAMPFSLNLWMALLNNFVIEVANFDGADIGWLHTVREIPGFLSIAVIALIIFMREQVLGIVSLLVMGVAVGVTAWFPTFQGLIITTLISSIGFHFFETVYQSLQLQWLDKKRAPQIIAWLVAAGSAASLVVYTALVLTWKTFDLSYNLVFLLGGSATVVIALVCLFGFPQFEGPEPQNKKLILRKRYWLYYALQFMAGARRQVFVVFAAFMMVERFGFEVHQVTALFLINYVANMIFAPLMGRIVTLFGEQRVLLFEYFGLVCVFIAYGGIYFFGWGVMLAMVLYVVDHLLFSLAFALNTYFQKIADPADIAPTAAVTFTINHIAAVFLPVLLGYLWIVSPGAVFSAAAAMAAISLFLALLIPRHPEPGHETRLTGSGVPHGAK